MAQRRECEGACGCLCCGPSALHSQNPDCGTCIKCECPEGRPSQNRPHGIPWSPLHPHESTLPSQSRPHGAPSCPAPPWERQLGCTMFQAVSSPDTGSSGDLALTFLVSRAVSRAFVLLQLPSPRCYVMAA